MHQSVFLNMNEASFIFVLLMECITIAAAASNVDSDHIQQIYLSATIENRTQDGNITFNEKNSFKMTAGDHHLITWATTVKGVKKVDIFVDDEFVSAIYEKDEIFLPSESSVNEYKSLNLTADVTVIGFLNLSGNFVGYNKIHVELFGDADDLLGSGTLRMAVLLKELFITQVYFTCLGILQMIVFTNMGANLDLHLVNNIAKQPIGPAIGLFCQYICMPFIAFCVGLLVFPNEPLYRLGLFASGSSPGGGVSNMWTHLLGGSLDLSIMMTFTSTVVALGAVPFWLLTLGSSIVNANFVIPYKNVIIGIFIIIIPCFLGILMQLKCPRLTKIMKRIITPLSLFNVFFIFAFGIYANFYVFSLITWQSVVAGVSQSLCGFAAGALLATVFRRSLQEVIAICIETAVQNNGVAFVLLKLSLESPAGDLAVVMPACATLATPTFLITALLIKTAYEKCCKKESNSNTEVVGPAATEAAIQDKEIQLSCKKMDQNRNEGTGFDNQAVDIH